MLKPYQITLLLFLALSFMANAQQRFDSEQIESSEKQLTYKLNWENKSFQEIKLCLDIKELKSEQKEIFISILSPIDGYLAEIARFYLPEIYQDGETFKYDFELCIWQQQLLENPEILFQTNGNFNDIKMDVYTMGKSGTPSIKVKRIVPLWYSGIEGYKYEKQGVSKELLPAKNIQLSKNAENAFVQILVSGKAKSEDAQGRFYFLNINNKDIAKRSIWRDDCSLNPISPQNNDWYKERPNWCPGLKVHPLNHFIEKNTLKSGELDISMRFQKDYRENSGIDAYITSANLFVLEEVEEEVNVAITEILSPNTDRWHQKYNPICGSPVILVKNLGQETLEQITFNYGYNYQTDNKFRWTGELGFMEEEIIYLPPLNWYFFEKDDEPESFTAHISAANGLEKAFTRGKMTTEMELAEVYPYRLTFHIRSDRDANNTGLEIFDDNGTPYFVSGELVADSNYYFHVNFTPGCYEMILFDQEGNGIKQRDEKLPVLEIIDQRKGTILKDYNGDFGSEIREQFMIFR